MHAALESFFQELRQRPRLAAAAASDPSLLDGLSNFEDMVEHLSVHDDPDIIAVVDDLQTIAANDHLTHKSRWLAIIDRLKAYLNLISYRAHLN